MGLITYNGRLLAAGGSLANTKDCCCGHRNCYCFTHTVNYQVVARWMKCYRDPVWDATNGVWLYPDGQPCDGGANGSICPPGSVGRYVNMSGNIVRDCGCGGGGESSTAVIITSQAAADSCTTFGIAP